MKTGIKMVSIVSAFLFLAVQHASAGEFKCSTPRSVSAQDLVAALNAKVARDLQAEAQGLQTQNVLTIWAHNTGRVDGGMSLTVFNQPEISIDTNEEGSEVVVVQQGPMRATFYASQASTPIGFVTGKEINRCLSDLVNLKDPAGKLDFQIKLQR